MTGVAVTVLSVTRSICNPNLLLLNAVVMHGHDLDSSGRYLLTQI